MLWFVWVRDRRGTEGTSVVWGGGVGTPQLAASVPGTTDVARDGTVELVQ